MTDSQDIIIVGSGLAGSTLGAILARHGAKVLIIDAGKHPRFSIGESTVRDTTKMIAALGDCFDIPELSQISGFLEVDEHVTKRCGLKRNFGFVYHREGVPQDPDEVYQVVIPDAFDGPEAHYFRADVDHYLARAAVTHGARLLEQTRIEDIAIDEAGVEVRTEAGERFRAKYIVDGTGFRSLLAQRDDLRERPPRFKTHSRSLFTHMRGVKPWEQVSPASMERVPRRWSQGTLHQCFEGGWLWVIPFNNGPAADASNPLISVGLQLDPRRFPFDREVSPEQEFAACLGRYPGLAEQFAEAELARPWVSTGPRMQYSSTRTIGDRYCLTAHAAGFLDPIYSRGLALTTSTILILADELLAALADDDFSTARFEELDVVTQRSLDRIDDIVAGSYTSWRDFELWNAWVRVWYASVNLSTLHLTAAHERYRETGSRAAFREQMYQPHPGSFCPSIPSFQGFFAEAVATIDAVEAGELDSAVATDKLFALLAGADFIPPVFLLDRPEARYGGKFDRAHWIEMVRWGNYEAPEAIKQAFFPGDPEANMRAFEDKYARFFEERKIAEIKPFLDATLTPAAR